MKKILVSSLLGSVLAFNVLWGEEPNQLAGQYLSFLSFADGNPCDTPNSEQCFNDAKEACSDWGDDKATCINLFISRNNTASYQSEYADGANRFVKEIFTGNFTNEKQKTLSSFLQEYKNFSNNY